MAISSLNPSISSLTSTAPSDSAISAAQQAQKNQNQQVSTVVSLSSQGQQLNRADTQSANNTVGQANSPAENRESRPQEASEKPGIQFMEGESKGGRVNTFA